MKKKNNELNNEKVMEFILSEERTLLSKQRTSLAFMQAGIATIGLGLVAVKFWTEEIYRLVGGILIVLGFYEIGRAYKKLEEYNRRLKRVKDFVKKSKWGKYEYGEDMEQ